MSARTAKILIMAGGTGGHVFPALTIATELLARGASVEWLGTRQGLEATVVPGAGIPLHFISISGLRGKSLAKVLLAPLIILCAIFQALREIRRIQPQCVLGMGGFATGPGGVAARLLGKKLLIHEQNAIAGLTNRLLYPFASVVMEGFAGAFGGKGGKTRLVGNPVRAAILALAPPAVRFQGRAGPLRLLVVGGSLGAVAINQAVPAALAALAPAQRPTVRHQCGVRNLEQTRQWYREAGLEPEHGIELQPFIEDMAQAYAWADLVLCRAGASTLAELTALGLPAVLVPYPHAVDDHQDANAAMLVNAGAARLLPQGELNAASLAALLRELSTDRAALARMSTAALTIARRDAGDRAATLCLEACHG